MYMGFPSSKSGCRRKYDLRFSSSGAENGARAEVTYACEFSVTSAKSVESSQVSCHMRVKVGAALHIDLYCTWTCQASLAQAGWVDQLAHYEAHLRSGLAPGTL